MKPSRTFASLLGLVAVLAVAAAPVAMAKKKPSVKLARGATTLALDAGTAAALTGLGIAVAPLKPARAASDGIRFPITSGRLSATTYAGSIRHTGGLRLSDGSTTVALRNFAVRVDDHPDLTALLGDARVSIADLDLSDAGIEARRRAITISRVAVALSAGAAEALNAAFGTDAFMAGMPLGEATVKARVVARKKAQRGR